MRSELLDEDEDETATEEEAELLCVSDTADCVLSDVLQAANATDNVSKVADKRINFLFIICFLHFWRPEKEHSAPFHGFPFVLSFFT